VPAGTVRGLPVGLQLGGARLEDATVLQAAALVERLGVGGGGAAGTS
jgi:Asp-tRNA(Asn)/Glu-tRNA(Gln) amidotransferase A subunit family amidase